MILNQVNYIRLTSNLLIAFILTLLIHITPFCFADSEKASRKLENGYFLVRYEKANGIEGEIAEILKDDQSFDKLISNLNELLILPKNIPVVFTTCGEPNAFYYPLKETYANRKLY